MRAVLCWMDCSLKALATLGVLLGTASAAPSVPVTVTNDPAHAVPVTVQGIVKLGSDPAPAAAITAAGSCPQPCSATWYADVPVYTVPAGKRLVIEYVSGFVRLPAGAQAILEIVTAVDGTYLFADGGLKTSELPVDHVLGPVTQAGNSFSVASSLRLYADPGTTVTFHVDVETPNGTIDYALVRISGYLVDI
jgi:hypothetical protein